jgi:transposase
MSVRELLGHLAGIQETVLIYPSAGAAPKPDGCLPSPRPKPASPTSSTWTSPSRALGLGPLPHDITVPLDADYDSDKTRTLLDQRGLHGRIAHKGEKASIQASRRWHVERTHARQNAFQRLARCYERRAPVIDARQPPGHKA